MTYVRGSTNTLTLSGTSVSDSTVSLSGSTTFTVVNSNQVNYAAFTATASSEIAYSVLAGTLTRSGNTYLGSLQLTDGLPSTYWIDYANYRVVMTDNNNSSGDGIPDFSDPYAVAPTISTQPASQTVNTGAAVVFSVTASSAQSYQWNFNGVAITGAISSTLSLPSTAPADAGTYTVTVSNAGGSLSSSSVTLTVNFKPVFSFNPVSVTVANGRSAAFSVAATGSPTPTYQWALNGATIVGATDSILEVKGATSANAGTYTCTATNSIGVTTSSSATLSVTTISNPGYLINISARANVGTLNNILIGGFGISGSGTKQLLLRGVGPGLFDTFSLTGELVNPQLTLLDNNGALIASNIGWTNNPTLGPSAASDAPQTAPASIMTTVGAFAYQAGSADTSLLITAPAGNNTAQVSGVAGTGGIALCEIYDADSAPTAHLINISARANVGTLNNILIGGFAIGGSTAETVLIRAVGPGLTDVFGLPGTLAQPVLTLFQGSSVIYSNTVWGGDATIAGVFPTVGAFNLNASHQDSALLVTLPPGNYTAQVSGLNGGTGIALCEIYEVQ